MPFPVGELFTIEVEHQLEGVGGHRPTLDHLVHTRLMSVICLFIKKRKKKEKKKENFSY